MAQQPLGARVSANMGRRGALFAGLGAALLVSGVAWAAAPGKLDRSFGRGGVAQLDMGAIDRADSVAIGEGRRIVLAGGTRHSSSPRAHFDVARLTPDGRPDRDFSGDGRAFVRIGRHSYARAAAIDPQHRVVVAGDSCSGHSQTCEFAVARFTPDGSLDPSFGNGGVMTTAFPGGDAHARAVAVGGGRIVVAGVADGKLAVARYRRDGLDTAFGSGGTTTVELRGKDVGNGVVLGERNRVVVASGNGDLALTEFNREGRLRRSFGRGGTAVASFRGHASAASVALYSRQRFVAAGYDEYRGPGRRRAAFAVARFDRNGELDDSFSGNGKVETRIGQVGRAKGVGIDSRGRIDVAGSAGGAVGLVRYRPHGRLDRSFGGDGKVRSQALTPRAATVDRRGKILVAGSASEDFAVARFVGYRHR